MTSSKWAIFASRRPCYPAPKRGWSYLSLDYQSRPTFSVLNRPDSRLRVLFFPSFFVRAYCSASYGLVCPLRFGRKLWFSKGPPCCTTADLETLLHRAATAGFLASVTEEGAELFNMLWGLWSCHTLWPSLSSTFKLCLNLVTYATEGALYLHAHKHETRPHQGTKWVLFRFKWRWF